MTKKELTKYVISERNKVQYSICFKPKDVENLVGISKKILSKLKSLHTTYPDRYMNLKDHIDRVKSDLKIRQDMIKEYTVAGKDTKAVCRSVRIALLSNLKKIVLDNSD